MALKSFPTVSRWTSIKNAFRLVHNPIPVVNETVAQMGPTYFFHMGGKTKGLMTQDLDIVQHILQKNHRNYYKSPLQTDELASYVGKGLLTNNGPDWLRQRRLIQPAFSRKNIDKLAILIEEEVINVLSNEIGEGGNVRLGHLSAMVTFHIVARAIFSNEVSHEQIVDIRDRVEQVQRMLILQVRQPYKRWYYHLSGQIKRHHNLADGTREIVKSLAQNRRNTGQNRSDILQFLLDTRYEDNGQPMSMDQLTDELIILMVAGHETTAHSLTWTLFLLTRHPNCLAKLMEEIQQLDRSYMEYFAPTSYLMAVIKESMRLYPPAWVIDRIALDDDEVNGYEIPKETIIMNYVYGIHRNEAYWSGPNEFIPERFIEDSKPAAYFPFGSGPRICIGNHFAYLELIITLVNLLKSYKLPVKPLTDPGIRPLITLQPAKTIVAEIRRKK